MAIKESIWLGFDCGKKTGLGVWDRKEKKLLQVSSGSFWEMVRNVDALLDKYEKEEKTVRARIEDSRKDNVVYRANAYFNRVVRVKNKDAAIAAVSKMGRNVGKVDRDAELWEDYFKSRGIPVELVSPKARKRNIDLKLSAETFQRRTGWEGRTNEHARDAAMLVYRK